MPYICAQCRVPWPCTNVRHNNEWSAKQWYPEGHNHSIACFVFDHDECTAPAFCYCQCHNSQLDDESPLTVPPSNR